MAANIFTGATNNNWNTGTNWSTGNVPTANDGNTATFNAASPACTVNAVAVCNAIDFTGAGVTNYANTITMTNTITSSGAITLTPGMTFAGASALIGLVGANLTSNAKTVNIPFQLKGTSQTYTLIDNWAISGLFTCNGTTATTINGAFTITCSGGYTQTTVSTVSGTVSIKLTGGTWSGTAVLYLQTNLEIAGNITVSGNVAYDTGTLLYTSGTVTTTGSTVTVIRSTTFNTSGMTWNNINFQQTMTVTLSSNFNLSGTLSIAATTTTTTINGFAINCSGSFTVNGSGNFCTGTTNIVMNGTGNLGAATSGSGTCRNNLTINSAGTITMLAFFSYRTGTFTFDTTTNSNTLQLKDASCTLDVAGITWMTIAITAAITITLNGILYASGTMSTTQTVTFTGGSGFSVKSFTCTTAGRTITLEAGDVYDVSPNGNGALTLTGTAASPIILTSNSGSVQAILTLHNLAGTTQDVSFVTATRINSENDQTIWNRKGTLTTASNWALMVPPSTAGYTYFN